MKLTRRSMARLVLGSPVAAAAASPLLALLGPALAAAADPSAGTSGPAPLPEPEPTPMARFLARQDDDLTSAERKRVRRSVTQLEQSLHDVREFKLGNEIPPSGTFRALKSKRS